MPHDFFVKPHELSLIYSQKRGNVIRSGPGRWRGEDADAVCVYVHGRAVQQCTKSWRSAAFRASRGASTPARRWACAWARCALSLSVSWSIRQQVRADRLRLAAAPHDSGRAQGGIRLRVPVAARCYARDPGSLWQRRRRGGDADARLCGCR